LKKGKLSVIGLGALLLFIASMFSYTHAFGTENEGIIRGSELSQEERSDINTLIYFIRERLHQEGYGFVLDHAVLPNENIEIIVKLGSEKVDKKTKKEIAQIVTDVIKQNNFDSDLFQFNITSFYNSEREGNHFSQRLSYNDLMGDIMQSLNAKGFDVAVQGKVLSDENVEISLVLPDNKFDEKTKNEVQQLATAVIDKNNFETEIFQFNITSYINTDD